MDVNGLVIKVYITQKYDNKRCLIVYYLRKMSKVEQNYNIYDKKLFIIIKAFKQW